MANTCFASAFHIPCSNRIRQLEKRRPIQSRIAKMTMKDTEYDLVVVGAGPVGLLAAHGAARRGCERILVLEQARAFKKAGAGLDLLPNCLNALNLVAPDVFKSLKASSLPSNQNQSARFTPTGELWWKRPRDARTLQMGWYELQTALRCSLPENVEVHIDAQVISLSDVKSNAGVVVKYISGRPRYNPFSPWNIEGAKDNDSNVVHRGEEKEVRAKLVIGADGINSRCREELYRLIGGDSWATLSPPIYTGYSAVFYTLPESCPVATTLVTRLKEEEVSFGMFQCGGILNRVIAVPLRGTLALMSVFRTTLDLRNKRDELISAVTSAVEKEIDYAPLSNLFEKIESKEVELMRFSCLPQYVVPSEYPLSFSLLNDDEVNVPEGFRRPFGYGRVFLAGDSLHGCPPTMAQGTAMGFEDVCELIDLLADAFGWGSSDSVNPDNDMLQKVEESYRQRRMERIRFVHENSVYPKVLDLEQDSARQQFCYNWTPKATGW